jgi:hypothetical protein
MTAVQTLSIVTPSYLPDLELCRDLQASVLNFTAPDVDQFIIVPAADRTHFADLAGARTKIRDVGDFLPRSMVKVPAMNMWVNACRPFPPVRGWVAQQIVKLAAAAAMTTDVVLLLDSDVLLIRSLTAAAFAPNGVLQLFELPDGVDATLPRHRVWHHAARRMLGLPPLTAGLLPDYICWPCAWSPANVRDMLARVESVTGLRWQTAVGRELHFSEMILYGVYVREVLGAESPVDTTARMRCVNHSDEIPLDEQSLRSMLDAISPEDLAIMVSAKSGTDLTTRRSVLNAFQAPA